MATSTRSKRKAEDSVATPPPKITKKRTRKTKEEVTEELGKQEDNQNSAQENNENLAKDRILIEHW